MNNNINENSAQSTDVYQHNGQMLADYFAKHSINRSALARKIGVAPSTVLKYLESESLQFRILWKISIALKHNFISELSAQLPINEVAPLKSEEQIEIEKEVERLKIELSVYKSIVGK
jgi:transcriptional regulator with XRE-family HTH domain